jgi:hypothetical protein
MSEQGYSALEILQKQRAKTEKKERSSPKGSPSAPAEQLESLSMAAGNSTAGSPLSISSPPGSGKKKKKEDARVRAPRTSDQTVSPEPAAPQVLTLKGVVPMNLGLDRVMTVRTGGQYPEFDALVCCVT